ncbi:MAG: alpha/beta fold hydrolase [Acetobacteraceae bacterium]
MGEQLSFFVAPSRVTRLAGLSALWAAGVPFGADALTFFRSSVDSVEARQAIISQSTGHRLPVAWYQTMAQASATGSRPEAYAGYLEAFVHDDFAAAASALEVDALLVSGTWDSDGSRVQRDRWQNGMRRLETVVLKECGHWAIHEAPLLTAAVLEGFLERGVGAPCERPAVAVRRSPGGIEIASSCRAPEARRAPRNDIINTE